jgi:FkbM family methyltransferase
MNFARHLAEWRNRAHLLYRPDALSRIELRPGDVAIDCGANVGLVTRRLARPGVIVYAFEPNPYAFAELQARFHGRPNVHCRNQGVLDTNGAFSLYLHQFSAQAPVKWSTGSSLLANKGNVDPAAAVEVEVIDLAQFVLDLNRRVAVLKLDVEGVEYRILNRMLDAGALGWIDHILVEAHEKRMPALAQEAARVRQRLDAAGITHIDWSWI